MISSTAQLMDAIQVIESHNHRLAVVLSDEGFIEGTITDGDIRRHFLAGGVMSDPVKLAMNTSPVTADMGTPNHRIKALMAINNIAAIPLVDEYSKFFRVAHLADLEVESVADLNPGFDFAVIMAGGEGTRLRPITNSIPKPMVPINGTPLLERQVRQLASIGLKRLFISVNFLSHLIIEHFGDGSKFGLDIKYLSEDSKRGTAGCLGDLPDKPKRPVLVMNGDILSSIDLREMQDFHLSEGAEITVGAIQHEFLIPYGVIINDGAKLLEIQEKPVNRVLCNAGIYIFSHKLFDKLPAGQRYDMTELITWQLQQQARISVFPIHETWIDIGTKSDLARAQRVIQRNDANEQD